MTNKSNILSSFKLAAFYILFIMLGYCLFYLLTYTYNYWLLESYKLDLSQILDEQNTWYEKELTRSDLFPFYEIASNPLHHYLLIIFVSIIAFFRVPPRKFEHVLLSSLLTFLLSLICCVSAHFFIVLAAPLLVWLSSYIFYRKKSLYKITGTWVTKVTSSIKSTN